MAHSADNGVTRRDFIYVATAATAAVGAGLAAWPLINQMNPSAASQALSETEVDLSSIAPGQMITVMWRKQPVFIRRRTPEEIKAAEDVSLDQLRDPQADSARVYKPEWLVLIGICTHLGCIPPDPHKSTFGEFGGWLCPCHGSHYDTSGRIRKGPAPRNLDVPAYTFVSDTKIVIGQGKTPAAAAENKTA